MNIDADIFGFGWFVLGIIIGYWILVFHHYRGEEENNEHGPNSRDIVGQTFQWHDGKYYQFEPEIRITPILR